MYLRRQFLLSAAAGLAVSRLGIARVADDPVTVRRVQVAQIGTGHGHAAGKIETVRRLRGEFEVVGICGAAPEDLAAPPFAGLPVLKQEELLAGKDVEAVLVETAVPESAAAARAVVQAGKHVHLDKPGALHHEEFATLRKDAETRGLVFQMGYMLRYNPAFQLMARAVKEGWLGRITEIDAMMGKKLDPGGRAALKNAGMSGMLELGCHLVDVVCWLMGGRPQRVESIARPTGDDGFIDNQIAVLTYPAAVATLRCNMADPFGNPRRRFMLTGTEGSIEVMPLESGKMTLRLTTARGGYKSGEQQVALPVGGRYDAELKAFASAVRGGPKLEWDAAHDIAVHETALRAAGAWSE